jgi:hypothetical protein
MKRFIILLLVIMKLSVISTAGNPGCEALTGTTAGLGNMPPIADAGADQALDCFITALFLNGTASSQGGVSYSWTTQDGHIIEGENTTTPLVDAAGTYTLTVTDLADGSTASDEVVVIQLQPITIQTIDLQDVSCHSTATGLATVQGAGGSGVYSYAWSSGSLTATATGLVAGSYTVTVTDSDGCSATSSISVNEPAPLAANSSTTPQSIVDLNDGTATANPSGGTAPYSYLWNNLQTTQTISGLPPGAYTLTVTDGKGCTFTEAANVNRFNCVLTGTISINQVSCFGGADGGFSVQLSNAVPPIIYNLPGSNTAVADGLAAGTYTALVRDSTTCSLLFTVNLTQPTQVSVAELFHQDVQCPTDTNGSLTIAPNGGVQPYQYGWSNGSTDDTASGLGVGEHTITLTDAKGCSKTLTPTIIPTDSQPPTLVILDALTVALNENGSAAVSPDQFDDGSIDDCGIASWSVTPNAFNCSHIGEQVVTIMATDANGNSSAAQTSVFVVDSIAPGITCRNNATLSLCDPVLNFQMPVPTDNCAIVNSQLLQTEGLPSGASFPLGETTQRFTYTDAGGNMATCSFTVTVVNALSASLLLSDATCNGICNGAASLSVANGITPYNVLWNNGATGTSIANLCAGDYIATLTDASGCEIVVSGQVAEPSPITVELDNIVSPFCGADSTGLLSVEVSGGVPPYGYDWGGTSGTTSIDSLSAGSYTLFVTDANGCSTSFTQVVAATDNEIPQLQLNNLMVSLDSNGMALLSPQQFDAGSTDNCSIDGWSLAPPFLDCGDLGTVTVAATATDGAGNTATGTFTVTVVDNIAPTLICPANFTVGNCNSMVNFSPPFLSDNCTVNATALVQTGGLFSGSTFPMGTTTQSFSYTDASGNSATCSFTITVGTPLVVLGTPQNISCPGACDGQVTLNISGGQAPYQVQWNNGETGTTLSNLCPGTVTATVIDAFGCVSTYTATVTQPPALSIAVTGGTPDIHGQGLGSLIISVVGGVSPYTFEWTKDGNPFSNDQNLTGLNGGTYVVVVTDANGCTKTSIDIIVENLTGTNEPAWATELRIFPNPASTQTLLSLVNSLPMDCELHIVDPLGRVVFSDNLQKGETHRTIDLRALPPGAYSLLLRNGQEVVVRNLIIQ